MKCRADAGMTQRQVACIRFFHLANNQKSPISSGLFAHPFKMDKMDKQMDKVF